MVFTFEFEGVIHKFETLEALKVFIKENGVDPEKAAELIAQFYMQANVKAAELIANTEATSETAEANAAIIEAAELIANTEATSETAEATSETAEATSETAEELNAHSTNQATEESIV